MKILRDIMGYDKSCKEFITLLVLYILFWGTKLSTTTSYSSAQELQNIKRNLTGINGNVMSFSNFKLNRNRYLNMANKKIVLVRRVGQCALKFLKDSESKSFNFAIHAKPDGQHNCEILRSDRFRDSASYSSSHDYHHYNIKTPCQDNPCQNGATCRPVYEAGTCSCECVPGFNGTFCETNIDECASNPCQNGGTCADHVNRYTCACAAGYTGTNCAADINECVSNPCQNGGSCADHVNRYTCTCAAGYSGTNCQTDINECASNPCQNGGSCADHVNRYACACPAGYAGTNCQTDINECASNPCQNGGSCADHVNRYTCSCASGYSGTNCQQSTSAGGCGTILRHDPNTKDMTTNLALPSGWTLCYIDQRDSAHQSTPCRDLLVGIPGYSGYQALLNAGGNFGCWHGVTGAQYGPSYASNEIIKNACKDGIQQTTTGTWGNPATTTMGVCIRKP